MPSSAHVIPLPRPAPSAWWWLGIAAAALAAFFPALSAGFIWDDHPGHITRADLQSLAGLWRIWAEPGATQQYYPLLHSFFWLQHQAWGDTPAGYHLVNVLLHAANAVLFGLLLRRLGIPGARAAALLFAVHPVAVETVAWVSEQKNTLSTLLYLSAALAYLRWVGRRTAAHYATATVLFTLALLSKTVTATLPAALLVLQWWRVGRLEPRRDWRPLLPWFALSLAAGLLTVQFERAHIGASGAEFALSFTDRLAVAVRAPWFYLGKLLWPANLAFIYPRWATPAPPLLLAGFGALTAAALAALFVWRTRLRGPLTAALFFGGSLFPALGFFNVYPFRYSFVADHFQYLACLGPIALAAAAGSRLAPRVGVVSVVAAAVALGTLTWRQSRIYRDVFTLYEATLTRNPDCWMAHNNLAEALTQTGQPAKALPHLTAALRLRPDFPEALNNLGDTLTRLGRPAEAVAPLERAIALQPGFAEAHNNLGIALVGVARIADGVARFQEALRLRPGYAVARFNLGLTLARQGRTDEALTHFAAAAQLDPTYADAHLNWAIALTVTRRFSEAFPRFERALTLNPESADAHQHYARALLLGGRYDDALAHAQRAVELNPAHADARRTWAEALRQAGRREEADRQQAEAARLGAGR